MRAKMDHQRTWASVMAAVVVFVSLPASADIVISYVVVRDTAVRVAPSLAEKDITTLLKGDTVISTGSFGHRGIVRGEAPVCDAGWCFVLANGHYGYVPKGTYRRLQFETSSAP